MTREIPYWKVWRSKNRERWLEYCRQYRRNNPEKFRLYLKRHRDKNPEHILKLRKQSNVRRKKYIDNWNKTYYAKNKDKIISKNRIYERTRRRNDPAFRCYKLLKNRIVEVLKYQGAIKSSRVKELIGCDRDCLVKWIESKFSDGMTWKNHGVNGWHIDHIRPCASFNLADSEQQKLCFNYSNLQPLWAKDNRIKSDKYVTA